MNNVIYDTLRKKDFVVKNYLVKVSHELSLDLNDMLLLIYFMNQTIKNISKILIIIYIIIIILIQVINNSHWISKIITINIIKSISNIIIRI